MNSGGLKRSSEAPLAAALKQYEAGVKNLQKQNYAKAKEIFEKLCDSAPAEIADRARVHLRLCEQRMDGAARSPRSAEDLYNMGVAALNARQLAQAVEYLDKAQRLKPEREEVLYALAAALALQGNAAQSLEMLQASIRLRPENRIQARQDEDFFSLASDPRFVALMHDEVGVSARAGR